jgi:hypothetical protein
VGEFFDYFLGIVQEVEQGHLRADRAMTRIRMDWGGQTISCYIPVPERPGQAEIRRLVNAGVPERKARRIVRGK